MAIPEISACVTMPAAISQKKCAGWGLDTPASITHPTTINSTRTTLAITGQATRPAP
jgi:hypothetical protein